jgi:hypothetical protein
MNVIPSLEPYPKRFRVCGGSRGGVCGWKNIAEKEIEARIAAWLEGVTVEPEFIEWAWQAHPSAIEVVNRDTTCQKEHDLEQFPNQLPRPIPQRLSRCITDPKGDNFILKPLL